MFGVAVAELFAACGIALRLRDLFKARKRARAELEAPRGARFEHPDAQLSDRHQQCLETIEQTFPPGLATEIVAELGDVMRLNLPEVSDLVIASVMIEALGVVQAAIYQDMGIELPDIAACFAHLIQELTALHRTTA